MLYTLITLYLLHSSFGLQSPPPTEKYCGYEIPRKEVADLTTREQNFKYTEKLLDLQGEISSIAQDAGGDSLIYEVFFFLSNEKELGVYIWGDSAPERLEKISCDIFKKKSEFGLPEQTYLVFFTEDAEEFVMGVKSKGE